MIDYPTVSEVAAASHLEVCRWWRFLRSPENDDQVAVMNAIAERFKAGGGMTPAISKRLGWER